MAVLERLLLLCRIIMALCAVSTAIISPETRRRCTIQTNCGDCIRADPRCAWCAVVSHFNNSRCYVVDPSTPDSTCSSVNTLNPIGGVTQTSTDTFESLNQIVPRTVDVNIRRGETITFPVNVRPANNFPIDIYLLMDLSQSMNDDLVTLKTLGVQIAERIKVISTNFQLGFGSFVEKKTAPYVYLDPRRLADPCFPAGCKSPYSYHHAVDLTKNNTYFSERVNAQKISGNEDFPEGGFDGLLQTIVCTDFIGWRAVSRKLLVYLTDAGFHIAGDGKLGGIVRPHDGQCHMNNLERDSYGDIAYQDWDTLDYPSIGQIGEKIDQFDIIPVFAVVKSYENLYELLVQQLGSRAYVATLADDSSNIVELIEDIYNQITQKIVFATPNIPGLSVTVVPNDCSVGRIIDGVCSDVRIGEIVSFNVSVQVIECTDELMATRAVEVRVLGFGTFTINVTAICSCSCEDFKQKNSVNCNMKGTYACGSCVCNHGYFGETCKCDASGQNNEVVLKCPEDAQGRQCSGRGQCICGDCNCHTTTTGDRFFGPACECDTNYCPFGIGGERCSGSSRGECTCDGCRCLTDPDTGLPYSGNDCSCTPKTDTCKDPTNSTEICNGRGGCVCGVCQCKKPGPYFGTYCELCSGDSVCQKDTCDINRPNAQCAICVIEMLETFINDDIKVDELFDTDFIVSAINNGTLPEGTVPDFLSNETAEVAIFLPSNFSVQCNNSCPQLVIINQTLLVDYEILDTVFTRCWYHHHACDYRYYVPVISESRTMLPIHIEYPPVCLQTTITTDNKEGYTAHLAIPPWAIAFILAFILLIFGILALVVIKIGFLVLDWIEVRQFELELANIKYSKNENPLYRSAEVQYKNPIYGL